MFSYTDVKNLKWTNPEHTAFNCEVNFNHLSDEFVPFHCTKEEAERLIYTHSTELWERGLHGDFGPIAEYESHVGSDADFGSDTKIIPTTNTGDFT
jgi:hypothetical protein